MLLIVNADDLGASQVVNDAIFNLMCAGNVTSATIMANGPAFEDAVSRIPDFPECSFGVHLTLTGFRPLTQCSNLAPVLENGLLSQKLFSCDMSSALRNALRDELISQVECCLGAGIPVTHFDSHHFIHRDPRLFPVFKAVQRHFGIRRFRGPTMILPLERSSYLKAAKREMFRAAWQRIYRTRTTHGWCTFTSFHQALRRGELPRCAALDAMVHPGSTRHDFSEETALLATSWRADLPRDIRLASYHTL